VPLLVPPVDDVSTTVPLVVVAVLPLVPSDEDEEDDDEDDDDDDDDEEDDDESSLDPACAVGSGLIDSSVPAPVVELRSGTVVSSSSGASSVSRASLAPIKDPSAIDPDPRAVYSCSVIAHPLLGSVRLVRRYRVPVTLKKLGLTPRTTRWNLSQI
jgi:hypothetical protein